MSKWVPTWSYVAMDYGTVVATYENVSQRCLIRNNLAGSALRLRFNNLYNDAPLLIEHASVETVDRFTGKRGPRRDVTLNGQTRIVVPAEDRPWSDPLPYEVKAEEDLIVWLYFKDRCAVPSIAMTSAGKSWQIPEGNKYKLFGWLMPVFKRFTDTNTNGDTRPYIMTGEFERVFPFDIYPMQLIKACLIKDIDQMEELGIYEVDAEDFALCEVIDPSKTPIQQIIREGLEFIRKETS